MDLDPAGTLKNEIELLYDDMAENKINWMVKDFLHTIKPQFKKGWLLSTKGKGALKKYWFIVDDVSFKCYKSPKVTTF